MVIADCLLQRVTLVVVAALFLIALLLLVVQRDELKIVRAQLAERKREVHHLERLVEAYQEIHALRFATLAALRDRVTRGESDRKQGGS